MDATILRLCQRELVLELKLWPSVQIPAIFLYDLQQGQETSESRSGH